MKTISTTLAIVLILAGLGGAYYLVTADRAPRFPGEDEESREEHGEHAEQEEEGDLRSYASYEGRVEISEEAARRTGIEIAVAGPGTIRTVVTLPGEIALNINRIVHVVPRLAGAVREMYKNQGDNVKKGELLAVIDSRELADAKGEYLAASERRELAQARFTREKGLFAKKIASEEDYLSAKQALAELDISVRTAEQKLRSLGLSSEKVVEVRNRKDATLTDYPILSPLDGTIIEKHMSLGEVVGENAEAFLIADLSTVWAEIVVYAADLKRIRQGQNVTVHSEDLGIEAQGTISYIGALVGQQTRTARAIVNLPNPEGLWRPGLFVTITLTPEEIPVPVAAPREAIQLFQGRPVVFVKVGTTYEARPIEEGRSDGKLVEILSGLNAGETYVSKNSYLVKAEIEKAGAAHEH